MDLKRGISTAMKTAIQKPFYPVLFAFLDWPGAPVRAHTGVGNIVWNGQTWLGVHHMGAVEIPNEIVGGVSASEATVSLLGVPADLNGMTDDNIRGRAVHIWVGVLSDRPGSAGGNTLIGTPVSLFSGTMDRMNMTMSPLEEEDIQMAVSVSIRTGPSARSMASVSHSDEDQRRRYPADTAGRNVILAYAKAQKMKWPE